MKHWTKEQEFQKINEKQYFYVNQLIKVLEDPDYRFFKHINFTSATGTGKTNMIAKLLESEYGQQRFFVITTLSKSKLQDQTRLRLQQLCPLLNNYKVYGLNDYSVHTKRQAEDFLKELPTNKEIIWLRDEGHLNTNRWKELYEPLATHIVNISATPKADLGINCKFSDTYMLRTVHQDQGTPEDAIKQLLQVKEQHKNVPNYNPCLIVRSLDAAIDKIFIQYCEQYSLKWINLSEEDSSIIKDLCEDDNEYDVILNKFKITEGIDIRRAHVVYLSNKPGNTATTIQIIGRIRRNALLYKNNFDLFDPQYSQILQDTMQCYVYFNADMHVEQDETGDLCHVLCNSISVEDLQPNTTIEVKEGRMFNGYEIIELANQTGTFHIIRDELTGFNKIAEDVPFYHTEVDDTDAIQIGDKIFSRSFIQKHWDIETTFSFVGGCEIPAYYVDKTNSCNISINTLKQELLKAKNNLPSLIPQLCEIYQQNFETIVSLNEQKALLLLLQTVKVLKIPYDRIHNTEFVSYTLQVNDAESAMIGTDLMKLISTSDKGEQWIEDRSVTSKVSKYCKLNRFIEKKFNNIIQQYKDQLYNGQNNFNFDKKCNSCLGYVIEYYIKYLLWGSDYLANELDKARKEAREQGVRPINKFLVIRACMLKYKHNMAAAYGSYVSKIIPTISVEKLIAQDYSSFVETVITIATRAAKRIQSLNMNFNNQHSPILSIKHITGLADFISTTAILDIKATSSLTMNHLKQVLTYYYLSTKRSDLHVNTVMLYDVITDNIIKITL